MCFTFLIWILLSTGLGAAAFVPHWQPGMKFKFAGFVGKSIQVSVFFDLKKWFHITS